MIVWGGLNDIGPFYLNTGGRYCVQQPTPTPTPTPTTTPPGKCSIKEVSFCSSVISSAPADFIVQMTCLVDNVQPSGFRVNDHGPDSFIISNSAITFHYNTSPAVSGVNTIHILPDTVTCCITPSNEFTCTFRYEQGPRPIPSPRPRPTPRPRP